MIVRPANDNSQKLDERRKMIGSEKHTRGSVGGGWGNGENFHAWE